MADITSPFFSLSGQLQRVTNVVDTFADIGKNILEGNLLKGVNVSEKYKGTLIGNAADIITKPAVAIAAPAAVAALAVGGPILATAVAPAASKVASGVSKAASSAAKTVKSAAGTVFATKVAQATAPKQTAAPSIPANTVPTVGGKTDVYRVSQPTVPNIIPSIQQQAAPIYTAPTQQTGASTDYLSDITSYAPSTQSMISVQEGVNSVPSSTKRKSTARKASTKPKSKSKVSKKRKSSGSNKCVKRSSSTSRRRIRTTKSGQPYIILASGKARFIKRSSAKRMRKLSGGYGPKY